MELWKYSLHMIFEYIFYFLFSFMYLYGCVLGGIMYIYVCVCVLAVSFC